MTSRQNAAALAIATLMLGCRGHRASPSAEPAKSSSKSSSIAPPVALPEPRPGMVWIPGGPLVAGTPEGMLPRIVDEEMPGEQIILKGYYVDVFPYPNEEGAIPLSNVSQSAAQTLCVARGKRLCSELEWERACKGPDNHRYEYGDAYRADRCGTGSQPILRPSGMRVACRSDFGVADLHGGAFEWTSSPWGRGTTSGDVSVRGGNSTEGEVAGRCANAHAQDPQVASGNIGFRCCAGAPNSAEVVLDVRRGQSLKLLDRLDKAHLAQLLAGLPEEVTRDLGGRPRNITDHQWRWRPVGNEELFVTRLCSGLGQRPACGVVVDRVALGTPVVLGWASSRHWLPSVETDRDPRDLWMIGGDVTGSYQRLIQYRNGAIRITPEEHRSRQSLSRKKKHKRASGN